MNPSPIRDVLRTLICQEPVQSDAYAEAILAILDGRASEVETAALLTALSCRGISVPALSGAVRAVRARMIPLELPASCRPVIDTCGTGGDAAASFNVSTATAIVLAACGLRVAKHGNRSASGNSGSAEILTLLGIAMDQPASSLVRSLEEAGIAFLFAPLFHPALRGLAPIRKQLPFRTLFNLVGPLANPAKPELQLLGVPEPGLLDLFSDCWNSLPENQARVLLVCGLDGLDEVSLAGPTRAVQAGKGPHSAVTWHPSDFGLPRIPISQLRVSGPEESVRMLLEVLAAQPGPCRDVVLANCAAALMMAGTCPDLPSGVLLAREAIDSGAAKQTLDRWVRIAGAP